MSSSMFATKAYLMVAGTVFIILGFSITIRLWASLNLAPPIQRVAGSPSRLVIVLGSGGHTAELLSSLQALPTSRYSHRTYIVSSGDQFSQQKAVAFESNLYGLAELRRKPYGSYDISEVPRARRVHQSLITTPWSCLKCFTSCVQILATAPDRYQSQWETFVSQRSGISREQRARDVLRQGATPFPDLIVTNGPATGLVTVCAAIFLRFVGLGTPRQSDGGGSMRSLFIESWARIGRFSLTGRVLVATGACQRVLVQWEGLKERYGTGVEYIGPLVR